MEPAALAEGVPPEPLGEDVAVLGSDILPAEVVARIASFLCVRDLGRLACVSRHFVTPVASDCAVPGAMARLSIVAEGARLATLRHGATSGPPPPGAGSRAPCDPILKHQLWMRYLWELEHPPPPPAPLEPIPLQQCGPASWTTITCHSCGNALGSGFNANCNCGRCPYPPMVPLRECPCLGMGAVGLLRPPSPPSLPSPPPSPLRTLTLLERGGIELPRPNGDERYTVSPSCVSPAVDSSSIRNDPTALASRFRELGYLAFANFFSDDLTSAAADALELVHHSRCTSVGSDPVPADFEANLWSGASWSTELVETWRSLGTDATFTRLKDEAALSGLVTALSSELGYAGTPSVLPQFTFVRGKGTGAGTTPHVDFRTSETTGAGLDKTQPGFICWVSLRVPTALARHSELCFSPCSHRRRRRLAQHRGGGGGSCGKTARGRGSRGGAAAEQDPTVESDVLPPEFRAKMEAGQAQWHVLNQESGLAGNGTLVLMDLQLVHGATIGGTDSDTDLGRADELAAAGTGVEAYRYSWDTRFVCGKPVAEQPVKAALSLRDVRQCGPGQWTTVDCRGCGAVLGRGFRSNCHCGRCPRPPMVPVRKCPCGGVGPKGALEAATGAPRTPGQKKRR